MKRERLSGTFNITTLNTEAHLITSPSLQPLCVSTRPLANYSNSHFKMYGFINL